MLKSPFNFVYLITITILFSFSPCIGSNLRDRTNGTFDDDAAVAEALHLSQALPVTDYDADLAEALRLSQHPQALSVADYDADLAEALSLSQRTQVAIDTPKPAAAIAPTIPALSPLYRTNLGAEEEMRLALALSLKDAAPVIASPKPAAAGSKPAVIAQEVKPPAQAISKPAAAPKAAAVVQQALKILPQEEAIKLVKYVFGQKSQIRESAGNRVDEFMFIDGHFDCFYQLPNLAKMTLLDESVNKVKEFCEEKGINFNEAQALLYYFLNPLRVIIDTFDRDYADFKKLIESQDFKTKVLPAIQKATISDKITQEQAQANKPLASDALKHIGIAPIYTALKNNLEVLRQGVRDYKTISAEDFLKNSGITLKSSGLPPKKPVESQALPVNVQPTLPLTTQPTLPSNAAKPVQQKAPLPESVGTLQNQLNKEFEQRQKANGNETVMVYGKTVAPQYYDKLQENIGNVFQRMNLKAVNNFTKIDEILGFYDQVAKTLEYGPQQRASIEQSLKTSSIEHNNLVGKIYVTLVNSPRPQTQYEYLLTVASQYHRAYQSLKDKPEIKNEVETLLQFLFAPLIDQAGKCQTGMVGRMFMAQKALYDNLIDLYKKI